MLGEAEASPDTDISGTEESEQFDPGIDQEYKDSFSSIYKQVVSEAQLFSGSQDIHVNKMTLDTGASTASYIDRCLVNRFHNLELNPCRKSALTHPGAICSSPVLPLHVKPPGKDQQPTSSLKCHTAARRIFDPGGSCYQFVF